MLENSIGNDSFGNLPTRDGKPMVASAKQVLSGMCSDRIRETKSQANNICRPMMRTAFFICPDSWCANSMKGGAS